MKVKKLLKKTIGSAFDDLVGIYDKHGSWDKLKITEAYRKYGDRKVRDIWGGLWNDTPMVNITIKGRLRE